MLQFVFIAACLASFLNVVNAECANACNGHGKCTSYDMCICNRNWQANDCSERVCLYGLAHVDSPKGDLDHSGALTGPDKTVADNSFNYPYGTTEQFPQMQDSDLQNLPNSAHYYMECSNKGTCNRATGECQCYEGYDGVACQRASCPGYPNSCSGHGVCKTIQQLATSDNGNVYKLWDKDITMGCECDHGYSGPDCSLRECKYGVDPLYLDDAATVRYSTWDFAVLNNQATATFTDGQYQARNGQWAIRFFDNHGEDWLTGPIDAGSSCSVVVAALEAIPNNVIPRQTISCTMDSIVNGVETAATVTDTDTTNRRSETIWYRMAFWAFRQTNSQYGELSPDTSIITTTQSSDQTSTISVSGAVYRLKFYGNPGKLREPEIEIYLDGKRPSITAGAATGRVLTKVWTDGQAGEDIDHFADHCDGVTVTITATQGSGIATSQSKLGGLSSAETALLKACLGDADFDTSNNVDVYNWDYGTRHYPHIIKLVRTTTTYTDGGYYAALYFDGTDFQLVNPFIQPDSTATADVYDIYTTKGTLALTSNMSEATFSFGSRYIYTSNTTYDTHVFTANAVPFDGDLSCEVGNNNAAKMRYLFHCLDKDDMFTLLNWEAPMRNPRHINLYTAERLYTMPYENDAGDRFINGAGENLGSGAADEMHFMTHVINTDISTNWGAATEVEAATAIANDFFRVYKFFPHVSSQYNYVAPCSNRGLCDTSSGVCKCFSGYTSDACEQQISVSC